MLKRTMVLFVCVVTSTAFGFNPNMDESLVGWWPLNDGGGATAVDASGNGNHGSLAGNPEWVDGYLKGALQFDGDGDYINCGNDSTFDIQDQITMTFWIKTSGFTTDWSAIISKGDSSWRMSRAATTGDSIHMGFGGTTTSGNTYLDGSISVTDDQWHFCVGVYDGAEVRIYVDAELDVSQAATGQLTTDSYDVLIGENDQQTGRYLNAILDDVRIYNRALTEEELEKVMTGGSNPALASDPLPTNTEEDVALDAELIWSTGVYAITHDVYFGLNYDDVNDASRANPGDVLVSLNQNATSYVPGDLELDGVYYWRVDEVNENPNTIYKGNVWTFSAEPVAFAIDINSVTATASSIASGEPNNTINGIGLTEDLHSKQSSEMWLSADCNAGEAWIEYTFDQAYTLNEMHVWNYNAENENVLGYGIKEALIEVSVDGNEWIVLESNVVLAQAQGRSNAAVGTIIEMGDVTVSAVRITALSNWTFLGLRSYGLSEVRFTYIPTAARRPIPADGTTDLEIDQSLSWRSGRYASQHEVYLGTDVNTMSLVATVTEPEYTPDNLVYDASYVWSVNEVNETTGLSYVGDIWSFSTPAYYVVDNMESYSNDNFIYQTWIDGYEDTQDDNSSQVGLDDPPYVEQTIAYDGSQSMPMYYTNENSSMYATAVKDLDGEDWTAGGVQTLSLFVRGDMENEGGQLYVQVNNKKVTSDMSLDIPLWTQWNIPLADLGVNLSNITSITIGVDGVGEGLIYVDAIRLYREAPEVVVASDPTDDNLVVYYPMEDNLLDQSGNGHDASSELTMFYATSLNDEMGRALSLDGVDSYVDMEIGDLVSTLENCSFSVWVSIDEDSDGTWMRAIDIGTGTDNYLFLCPRVGTNGGVRLAILTPDLDWETGMTSSTALSEGWHHLAGVFDNGTLNLYVDSLLADSVSTETYPMDLGVTTQNWLGRSQFEADAYYEGLMDEVCIYDRALTAGEIRYIAGDR